MDRVQLSKKLSYLLRHNPGDLDLELTKDGFTTITIDELADRLGVSTDEVIAVVKKDEKRRFTIANNRIRANYGHSIEIGKTMYEDTEPIPAEDLPAKLYHGTQKKLLGSIQKEGLEPQSRQFVHLSYSKQWATKVGQRRQGEVVILEIDTDKALDKGLKFYDGGPTTVLVSYIPPDCITN